jgi:hypothetical protein
VVVLRQFFDAWSTRDEDKLHMRMLVSRFTVLVRVFAMLECGSGMPFRFFMVSMIVMMRSLMMVVCRSVMMCSSMMVMLTRGVLLFFGHD